MGKKVSRILVLHICFSLYPICTHAQARQNVKTSIDANCDFKYITEAFPNASVYFVGEFHESNNNENIHYEFFRYLYKNKGVKIFASEFPRSSKRLFDKYLKSGDELYLDSILKYFTNEERYKLFFKKLAILFSSDDSLVYMPLDIETNARFALQELYLIQKKYSNFFTSGNPFEKEYVFGELSDNRSKKIVFNLFKFYQKNKEKYHSVFSVNDFEEYDRILAQLYISVSNPKINTKDLSVREELLLKNIEEQLLSKNMLKFFLPIGEVHICLESNTSWLKVFNQWTSLAARLKSKFKYLDLAVGKIYYTNTGDYFEDYINSEFITDFTLREEIRRKTKFVGIYIPENEKRFNFLIINNIKNKKEFKLKECY